MGWWSLVPLVLLLQQGDSQLVRNGGFESGNLGNDWSCSGCHLKIVSGGFSGQHALEVTNRDHSSQGPVQYLHMKRNQRYYVSVRVKQLNDLQGRLHQAFQIHAGFESSSGNLRNPEVAGDQRIFKDRGWTQVSGYFLAPDIDFVKSRLSVEGPWAGVNFLVDDLELAEFPEDKNWEAEADASIEKIRKSDIHVRVTAPSHVPFSDIDIQVRMTKHAFAFGSAAPAKTVTDPKMDKWRELFFSMFNWQTMSAFYWKWGAADSHNPDYSEAVKAIDLLRSRGVKVRGHNIFWDINIMNPPWVLDLRGDALRKVIEDRIHHVLNYTRGKLEHWDVTNEMLHGEVYEERTGDRQYAQKIYAKVHQLEPGVKLFLNDYHVVAEGSYTMAYLQQAKDFRAANTGLYGLGVQCHFGNNTKPDATLVKKNLDILASSGYPLWATELDVWTPDENQRADWLEIAMKVLFSHPAVEGIVLWGFWGPRLYRGENSGLVSGHDFHVNAAGRRYLDLVKKAWSTDVTHKLTQGPDFHVRGFHGDYEVIVRHKGNPVHRQTFSLGRQGATVAVTVPANLQTINIPTTKTPFTDSTGPPHQVDHINEHTIGQSHSGSSNQLTCTTRWSAFSAVGDDKWVETSCEAGEVLTSCSSYNKDKTSRKDGEIIRMDNGTPTCRAYDSGDGVTPVQAVVRCCKLTGMQCEYRVSGPSRDMQGERIETRCANQNQWATGCSVHNFMKNMDGTFPTDHSCLAQNEGNHGHVESYAACCSAPHLSCHVKTSQPSGLKLLDEAVVSCETGYTSVGCSGIAESGGVGAVYFYNDVCHAVNGEEKQPGEGGVVAHVTCCKG